MQCKLQKLQTCDMSMLSISNLAYIARNRKNLSYTWRAFDVNWSFINWFELIHADFFVNQQKCEHNIEALKMIYRMTFLVVIY